MRYIFYSSKFKNSLKKIPLIVRKAFLEKESLFLKEPFHPALGTHKLHGKYKNYLAFAVTGQYRVMFMFIKNKNDVGFINIGDHDIYR